MENKLFGIWICIILAFSLGELRASDWKKVVELKGTWLFSIGDDPAWVQPSANTDGWHKISVPAEWERFYPGYNGFAWYRRSFDLKTVPDSEELVLFLGYIDDVDEVFINGIKIGQSGGFFPNYQTAYNVERQYFIPKDLLKTTGNVIAVRVYDEGKPGGIINGDKIGIYSNTEDALLIYNLRGNWKFTTRKYNNIHSPQFDDSSFKELYVPATWESQGYQRYDGRAWYRKEFTLPENFPSRNLYLVLGMIDELDKVYINGEYIGSTKDLDVYNERNINDAYRWYRSYEIPEGTLKKNNVISVEVLDKYGEGGIYSGPVGIMKEEDRNEFIRYNKVGEKKSLFRSILEYFMQWDQ